MHLLYLLAPSKEGLLWFAIERSSSVSEKEVEGDQEANDRPPLVHLPEARHADAETQEKEVD